MIGVDTGRENFYPRSPCGERPSQVPTWLGIPNFYPRSPCGERLQAESSTLRSLNFYPRSPCGERPPPAPQGESSIKFLSTLSLRRATLNQIPPRRFHYHFYPRSPCGERLVALIVSLLVSTFLSTLSLRRATRTGLTCGDGQNISIHALLAESDETFIILMEEFDNFYPRSPCGERLLQS